MANWLGNRENRKWIYAVCLAAVPLLVLYGVIDESAAPLWIALIGAVVAPSLALKNLTPPDTFDSLGVPDDLPNDVVLDTEE